MTGSMNEVNEAKTFADDDNIAEYAVLPVAMMQQTGIINGKPGNYFDPQNKASRAEVAAMLHRFMKAAN